MEIHFHITENVFRCQSFQAYGDDGPREATDWVAGRKLDAPGVTLQKIGHMLKRSLRFSDSWKKETKIVFF